MDNLHERLKLNYSDCDITQSDDVLIVKLPLGEARVNGNHVSLFIQGELCDELELENEEIYEEIELFILLLKEEEKSAMLSLILPIKKPQSEVQKLTMLPVYWKFFLC